MRSSMSLAGRHRQHAQRRPETDQRQAHIQGRHRTLLGSSSLLTALRHTAHLLQSCLSQFCGSGRGARTTGGKPPAVHLGDVPAEQNNHWWQRAWPELPKAWAAAQRQAGSTWGLGTRRPWPATSGRKLAAGSLRRGEQTLFCPTDFMT